MIFPFAAEIAHLQHRRTALPLPQIAHLIVKLWPVIRKPSRRVVTSAAGKVPTRLPSFSTLMRSDTAMTSSRRWLTKTMQIPSHAAGAPHAIVPPLPDGSMRPWVHP